MNLIPYIDKGREELETMATRQLLAAFKAARSWHIMCSCGDSFCDEGLTEEERADTAKVYQLKHTLKEILATREHVPTSEESKARTVRRGGKPEKKKLRY